MSPETLKIINKRHQCVHICVRERERESESESECEKEREGERERETGKVSSFLH